LDLRQDPVRSFRAVLTMRKIIAATVASCMLWFGAARADEPVLLSDPAKRADADRALVLIHGLLGSPRDSFGDWPRIIAADQTPFPDHGKFSNIAIYAVDYEAHFTSRATLEDVAKGVASELGSSAIFRDHRHVWLVAHSMGGLVLKRALSLWKLQNKTVLLDRIQGIGLLGVPSAGAPLADLADTLDAGKVAEVFGWNGELVKDLTSDSGQRYLDSLENDFIAVKATRDGGAIRRFTPLVWCGYETKPESRFLEIVSARKYSLIVPKLYAGSAGCDDKVGFAASHTGLIKPSGPRLQVAGWLRDLIMTSATAGLQEQWVAITTNPRVRSDLATRVDRSNEDLDPDKLDRATHLPLQPERIEFEDGSRQIAERLLLRGGNFVASTKSDLYEAIAKKNTCISAKVSPNRMRITLSIKGETKQCGADLVCANQSCD
jgi:pimeloyl-ACP methyl ester carboxylesterase